MKKFLIIAGEASGDLHGANLVKEMKKISAQTEIFGAGGRLMQEAGVRLDYNLVEIAVVGISEVIRYLGELRKIFRALTAKLDSERPDAVILIDYPDFNLRFAKEAKKRGIPVIYYISPQIWAWRKGRIKKIKQLVDKMLVIFKFEEELYRKAGVNVEFIGHPLLDAVRTSKERREIIEELQLDKNTLKITLLPGSRRDEIRRHLPVLLNASSLIHNKLPNTEFLLGKAANLPQNLFDKIIARGPKLPLKIIEERTYDCISAAELVLTASGTATLETAILKVPMIIIYRLSSLTYLITRHLIKLPYIGLANIVAGKKIVEEFIQAEANPENISNAALKLLRNPEQLSNIYNELEKVRKTLGEPGASRRAAEIILKFQRP